MNRRLIDLWAGIILLVFCVVILISTFTIPDPGFDPLGPAFMPRFAIAILVICALILINKNEKRPRPNGTELPPEEQETIRYIRPISVLAALAVYIQLLVMQVALFEWLTTLYLIGSGMIVGIKGRKEVVILVIVSLIVAFSVGYLFKTLFYVNLP